MAETQSYSGELFSEPLTVRPAVIIDPVALITTECIAITSAMRKHSRWAQSSVSAILGGGGVSSTKVVTTEKDGQRRTHHSEGGKGKAVSMPDPSKMRPSNNLEEEDGTSTLAIRWGLRSSSKRGKTIHHQDSTNNPNPLLFAFARLRRDLSGCHDIHTFDAPDLLHPFLQVIRSSSTSAAITSLAVISITKFLAYNIISEANPRIAWAMQLLSAAITHCRFEASDTSADEVVLLRILRLMEIVMTRPELGGLLGDESICEMMSTGLSMCCQARLSEVLRRAAEMAMVGMCQVVFERLRTLEVEERETDQRKLGRRRIPTLTNQGDELKIEPPLVGSVMGNRTSSDIRPSLDTTAGADNRTSLDATANQLKDTAIDSGTPKPTETTSTTVQANGEVDDDIKPYALPSIKELFRVLIDLLDPHNKAHTDPMRIMALRIIDVALEIAGPSIASQPSLAELVQDDLCRHLFQLVRSENLFLLNSSLRVAGTLLTTCRRLLKLQQELFLSYLVACLHVRVDIPQEAGIDPSLYEGIPQAPKLVKPSPSQPNSGRATPVPVKDRQKLGLEGGTRRPEARESMVESIGTLIRIPSFMIELFINYDCEVDRQDLCEDMVGLLSRNAFPDAATWSTTSVPPLCLDSLLSFIQFMAERTDQQPAGDAEGRIRQLQQQRIRKRIIKSGAAKFNDDPKAGVAYLVRNGIIDNPDDPVQVAQFLKGTSHVSKRVLGEFLTKKSNERLLTAFIGLFKFDGKRIDEALRDLLGSFRLPGESALIERIVNTFTENYCATDDSGEIADKDAAFIFTYAIIMLNTDLYNQNVKSQNRMSCEDFSRNLRGVNGGKDFSPDFLQDIYDAIKHNEIILPDEHENKHAFDYAWKELLLKTHDAGDLELCETNALDAEMFRATWKPVIATLCYVFLSASDDAVFSRVVVGFDQCAQIAAKYGITEAFDRIVYSLSQISGLAAEVPPSTSLNTEVQAGKKRIMVSELAVRLGRDFRAQLSTVLLFRILNGHESAVGETWIYLVRILRNLFVNSLVSLPSAKTNRISDLGPIPLQPPSQVIDRDGRLSESGIFSTFTSYLSSYAADDPPEPSEEELENTLSSVDCVRACQPSTVIRQIFGIPPFQVERLVKALLSQLEESFPVVTVKPERPMPVTTRMNGHRAQKGGPEYDPGAVFLLEFATVLTLRDEETVAVAGESLTGSLQTAVRDASNLHPLAASRIVTYLLDLLQSSYKHDFVRAPVFLHAISSFDDHVMDHTANAIISGLSRCISKPGSLRNEITNSPDFWSILHRLHRHKTQSEHVFEILAQIASAQSVAVTADNYESTVSLANDFASAGSIGSMHEQRRDQAAAAAHRRGGKQSKQPPNPKSEEVSIVVQRSLKAINIIYHLTARIQGLIAQSHLERNEAWAAYWSPIFRALCTQCVNPCREIRHRAISALQRTLLSEDLASVSVTTSAPPQTTDEDTDDSNATSGNEWTAIFSEILFPLILRLLKPETYHSDPIGMSETRVQAATLLCKIFLRYLEPLVSIGQMLDVWSKTLELLDRMMHTGATSASSTVPAAPIAAAGLDGGESLNEAVTEGVKNCLLVMAGSGVLSAPWEIQASNSKQDHDEKMLLWNETGRRLETFLPGLLEELFPAPPPPPPQNQEASEATSDSIDQSRSGVDEEETQVQETQEVETS